MTTTRHGRSELYDDRPLSAGYPGIESTSTEVFTQSLGDDIGHEARMNQLLTMLGRLVDIGRVETIAVVGCGPRPETVRLLDGLGYRVTGVEPVAGYVDAARTFLDGHGSVELGAAEALPFADGSQDLVLLESVLEHVDSPSRSLAEAFRVLAPGGVAVVVTTNRHSVSASGACAEFNVRFYNWLPALVKESYVFEQLHFRPELANYTPRPAVHWFSFSELCSLGRAAGFAHFYSHVDLLRDGDPTVRSRPLKRKLLGWVQTSPWARALALTQVGGVVFMWRRSP